MADLWGYVPVLVGVLVFSWGIYEKVKRQGAALWRMLVRVNRFFARHGEPPINPYVEETSLYGEILVKGKELIFRAHGGNRKLIAQMRESVKNIQVEGAKFYNKDYVRQRLAQEQDRLRRLAQLKKQKLKILQRREALLAQQDVLAREIQQLSERN